MTPQFLLLVICYFTQPLVIARRSGFYGRVGGGGSRGRVGGGGSYGRIGGGASYGRASGSYYPPSNSLSGTNTQPRYNPYARPNNVPPQNFGPAGNNQRHHTSYVQRTEVHHHYHYQPPPHISYGSLQHPVFRGQPPVYVYEYRNSGSRFDNLLTGLALYNLGRMSSHNHHNNYRDEYRGSPGEVCKLGISKSNGEYEESRIECKLMSSFIWDFEQEQKAQTSVISTSVNVMQATNEGGKTTFQNTTVVQAINVKGPSIAVTPEMTCFMIRISRDSSILKRKVECGLLQQYATRSLYYSHSPYFVPGILLYVSILLTNLLIRKSYI